MKNTPQKPPSDRIPLHSLVTAPSGDEELEDEVRDYNRRYLYWDELIYRVSDTNRRELIWQLMKAHRRLRYETIPYPPLRLVYSLTPEIAKNLHTYDRYLSGIIRINNREIRLEKSYIINSMMEEAIASSILEGAVTTRKKAQELLISRKKAKNTDEQMVINNYEVMQYIRTKKDEPISREMISDIQKIVTTRTISDAEVGTFRDNNKIVVVDAVTGTIQHTPPDHQDIEEMIAAFCRFANDDEYESGNPAAIFIHPIIKGIILHYLIGYIHPFADGNGRTARTIFYWYVLSRGYWLFEYMAISRAIQRSKKRYSLAYLHTRYDEMDLTYFINYNIACINEARDDLLRYIEEKQSDQKKTSAIIRKVQGINERQADILRTMMEQPERYFTIRHVMQMHDVVYETARTDLLMLVEKGYLRKEKRGRAFVFIFDEEHGLLK
ncbi:filamentation induced by cAMP protein Fic [Methanocalculus chunghsingensis]|uniref:Filamentation induced by cAMP protein Fic n=1 Tax=Methanocalculus chunghsingensis TaxID=156457 RepID=A0A8J7W862_9EURY|nr:Fic family protein [Methanocalculus chunghsingensis]MBR1369263.1 filamentation induced by cAMP protein Fic [Methanocalculus chunghsingensis]